MSFLNNLAKGFVRSAVNQVGRDGGKVISNEVYGNKHSTPVRVSNSSQSDNEITSSSSFEGENENPRATLINAGYQEDLFENSVLSNIFTLFGTFIIPYLGSIYWFFIALKNLFKTKTKFYGYEEHAVYKTDRRYKSGQRHVGNKKVKVHTEISPEATKSERIIYIIKGLVALTISLVSFYVWNLVFYPSEIENSMNLEIIKDSNIGIALTDTKLQENPNDTSVNLVSITALDTIQLLNESVLNSDSTKIWYKVKYKNHEGWSANPN